MAAPATDLTRIDPTSRADAIMLEDGFTTKIAIEAKLNITFWDLTVTPPGVLGGDPIDTTTMFSVDWRTKALRKLKELGDVEFTAGYDPVIYTEATAIVNVGTTINIVFSDGTVFAFFGGLREFQPQSSEEGSRPEVNCVITPTNWDPVNNVRAEPVLLNVSGT